MKYGEQNVNRVTLGGKLLKVMPSMIKQAKKASSLPELLNVFKKGAEQVDPFIKETDEYKALAAYGPILLKVARVKADDDKINKLLHKEMLENATKRAVSALEHTYNSYKTPDKAAKLFSVY